MNFLLPAIFLFTLSDVLAQTPQQTGEEFLSKYLMDFTEECKDFRSKVSSGQESGEPSQAYVEADRRMAMMILRESLLVTAGISDPYPERKVSMPILHELYFQFRWNDIEDSEKLYSLKEFSSGKSINTVWQCFEVTKHFFIPEMDSIVYLTIVLAEGDWKLAAMSRDDLMCAAAASSGLKRMEYLNKSLRHFQDDADLLTYFRLKSGTADQPVARTIWKGRETDFSAEILHDFLSVEVDPYGFEQAFLVDADFPFLDFAELAQLRCETQWDFSLFVPGPMDGILYRVPVTLLDARSSDRKLVTAEGRIVLSWAAFKGHETMQDFLDSLLPALKGWSPAPTPEEQTPAPPPEEQPESTDPSDQGTVR